MYLEPIQYALGALSGGLVGFTLGLFGGGGSILAVPLMVYIVGVPNPHLAIGTSAFAVAANALANVVGHARRGAEGNPGAQCSRENAPKVVIFGGLTGIFSGFFGIGGGFLIVPGLIASTGMPILVAIGSSLVAVTAFGLTTALNYAFSGLVDWALATVFIAGGAIGGLVGGVVARKLAARKGALNIAFATLIIVVAGYMLYKSYLQLR
ncbi:hypothetical protein LPJGGPFB_04634 [Ensifer adhaerens]|uniref:TSUP family transporter n=1 Tax=Ensifer adhaerens TaxID=106592 RepID=UPI0015690153|nr:TSUP family transporter [Ensifer adhaerens]NRP21375.1 hypothetical protein [Ensifer adhaerens]